MKFHGRQVQQEGGLQEKNCRNNSGHVPPMVFLQVSTSDDMGGKKYVMDKDGFPRTSLKKKGS